MKIRKGFISNSSSTSFVCDTTMSLDEVEKALEAMLTFYNDLFNVNHKFEVVFKHPFIADEDYSKYMKKDWKYICPVGALVIESASDNTIPYALFSLIEGKFNGYSNHLG